MLPGLLPLVHLETVTADDADDVTVPASGTIAGHANFPAGSKHVVVMYHAQTTYSGTAGYALVQVNGDTGGNYDMQRLDGFGSSVAAYKETGIIGWSQIAMMGAGDSNPSPGFLMVPNAFATTGYLAMIGASQGYVERSRFGAGTWENTAAMTSMTFVAPATGNGTGLTGTFSLYVVDESYLVTSGEEVLTGTSAFTNRSVPAQVGDISIVNYLRSSRSATNDGIALDINTDTTESNYSNQHLFAYNSTSGAGVNLWDNNQVGGCNASTADSNHFSGALTSISAFNYGDNDPHVLGLAGHVSVSTADAWISLVSMKRNNVEAVTSVNISPTVSSTFLAGSGQWVYAVPKSLISRTTLTGTATVVTFDLSSLTIPAGTTHLRVNCYARSDRSANSAGIDIQFNGDTGSNYNRQTLVGRGTTVAAGIEATSRTAQIPAASSGANEFGSSTTLIPWYAGSNQKTYMSFTGAETHSDLGVRLIGGEWENTAAITSIEVRCNEDNFVAGSIFELEAILHPSGWSGTFNGVDNPGKVNGIDKADIESLIGVDSA